MIFLSVFTYYSTKILTKMLLFRINLMCIDIIPKVLFQGISQNIFCPKFKNGDMIKYLSNQKSFLIPQNVGICGGCCLPCLVKSNLQTFIYFAQLIEAESIFVI